jgi:hypothetical protein
MDGQDVGVLEPGGEPDLALEPLGTERLGQIGMEDLERDRPVVPHVVGEIDRRHAAAPQLAVQHVPVAQGVGQGRGDSHGRA